MCATIFTLVLCIFFHIFSLLFCLQLDFPLVCSLYCNRVVAGVPMKPLASKEPAGEKLMALQKTLILPKSTMASFPMIVVLTPAFVSGAKYFSCTVMEIVSRVTEKSH